MKRLLIALSMVACSCEVIVDVDIPLNPPSITVNSIINPDSTFSVQLTPSQHILSNDGFLPIRGASVSIYGQDGLVETLFENEQGYYQGNLRPVPGASYLIEASHSGYETVTSSDEIPSNSVSFSTVSYEKIVLDEFNLNEYSFTVEFEEPMGRNFYEIGLFGSLFLYATDAGTGIPYIVDTVQRSFYIYSEDPLLNRNFDYNDPFLFFADDLTDGKVSLTFSVNIDPFYDQTITATEVIVAVREISPALYRYKQTSSLQSSTSGDPFAEPAPVFNNITKGFGIFGGYHQKVDTITVTRE